MDKGENCPFCLTDDIQVHRKKIHKFALNLRIWFYHCGSFAADLSRRLHGIYRFKCGVQLALRVGDLSRLSNCRNG